MAEGQNLENPTTVRFTTAHKAEIQRIAREENRSFGNTVNTLIGEALAARKDTK